MVTCLGVVVDSELTFAAHIKRLAGRCFYQLRQLRTVRRALSTPAARTLVHAFIICRVDYCNSIFGSTCAVHLKPLQSVLNAAVHLIVKRRKYDHISDSLRDELHWLPVPYRHMTYKTCLFVYKCLHGAAPQYLRDQLTPVVSNTRHSGLRSADSRDLAYPRTKLVRSGPRSFSVAGPITWNTLSNDIRDPSLSYELFCTRLKTELFKRAYHTS